MKLFAFFIVLFFLTGCHGYRYQENNLGEEILEEVVNEVTHGIIDPNFSPAYPEHGFSPQHLFPFTKEGSEPIPPAQPVKKK